MNILKDQTGRLILKPINKSFFGPNGIKIYESIMQKATNEGLVDEQGLYTLNSLVRGSRQDDCLAFCLDELLFQIKTHEYIINTYQGDIPNKENCDRVVRDSNVMINFVNGEVAYAESNNEKNQMTPYISSLNSVLVEIKSLKDRYDKYEQFYSYKENARDNFHDLIDKYYEKKDAYEQMAGRTGRLRAFFSNCGQEYRKIKKETKRTKTTNYSVWLNKTQKLDEQKNEGRRR